MKKIYLDYAAATPVSAEVLEAMRPYFTDKFYNPSAIYLAGREMHHALDEIRNKIAITLGAKPAEIVFTAGATEANNLAVQGLMKQFPDGELLVSAIEHESVLEPARLFNFHEIPVDNNGMIKLGKPAPLQIPSGAVGNRIAEHRDFAAGLSNLISGKTVLISVMYVNNELGTIQPLKEIAQLVSQVRKQRLKAGNKRPIYLHTDAAQAGNYLDLHVSRLGVDLMSINGGKIYGPKQSGALFVKAGVRLQPLIVGGGQEFGLRSGTENLAAAAGLSKALELAQQRRDSQAHRAMELRNFFEQQLQQQLPQAVINGGKNRTPHLVSVTFPGSDNERLMMQLDEGGIMCAIGSACSAARDEASHVLTAIGLTETEARSTLRFSLGKYTAKTDLQKTISELARLIQK